MKVSFQRLIVILFCICCKTGNAQNISINNSAMPPDGSAILDVSSSSKGLLIPRLNTAAINTINNPAKGLLVYDSSKNQLMVNMGTALAPNWQTIVFTVLCFSQLWNVIAIRSETRSLFKIGILSNTFMVIAISVTVLLQLAVIYLPVLNKFFHTQPLTLAEMLIATGISSIVFIIVELEKKVKRILKQNNRKESPRTAAQN